MFVQHLLFLSLGHLQWQKHSAPEHRHLMHSNGDARCFSPVSCLRNQNYTKLSKKTIVTSTCLVSLLMFCSLLFKCTGVTCTLRQESPKEAGRPLETSSQSAGARFCRNAWCFFNTSMVRLL